MGDVEIQFPVSPRQKRRNPLRFFYFKDYKGSNRAYEGGELTSGCE